MTRRIARIARRIVDRDIVVKIRRVCQVIISCCTTQIAHSHGICHVVGTICLLCAHYRSRLVVDDVGQVGTNLIPLFWVVVVVGIQRRGVVQTLTRYRGIGYRWARGGRSGTTGSVQIIAAIRRRCCQIQFYPIGQRIRLGSTCADADVIGQGIGRIVDQRQGSTRYCWYYIAR